jgi:hypothetical protein
MESSREAKEDTGSTTAVAVVRSVCGAAEQDAARIPRTRSPGRRSLEVSGILPAERTAPRTGGTRGCEWSG